MFLLILAVIVLALICAGLGVRVYAVERALRSAAAQLREREEKGSSVRILMAAPNSSGEQLISAVNGLLELRQAEEADYQARPSPSLRPMIPWCHQGLPPPPDA